MDTEVLDAAKLAIARRRVARGAALLDATVMDWQSLVNWDKVDIASMHDCVLGQIANRLAWWWSGSLVTPYGVGVKRVFPHARDTEERIDAAYLHGFTAHGVGVLDDYAPFQYLNKAWRELAQS